MTYGGKPEACATKAGAEVVELRHLCSGDLDAVLSEEIAAWREELGWDFSNSAELVRRFVDKKALTGFALVAGGMAAGYTYSVAEEHKGLVGDLYVRKAFRSEEREGALLGAVVESLMRLPHLARIEAQLMMLDNQTGRETPGARFARMHARNFMTADLTRAWVLAPGRGGERVRVENWVESRQEEAAHVIAAAYQEHIDGQVNDQYRSPAGARRFLMNIVQYPGCGTFFQPASFLAVDGEDGRVCGLCLASLVAEEAGHITQVCVAPEVRGTGVGYELMRRSLAAMAGYGCRSVSLTVTAANRGAVELYERMGFGTLRQFGAWVWEGF